MKGVINMEVKIRGTNCTRSKFRDLVRNYLGDLAAK